MTMVQIDEALVDDIAAWMREYVQRAKADGFVVGLSGGIDSATTAALATRAVGVDHVLGVIMPCHSQPADEQFALMAAEAFALRTIKIDLSIAYDTLIESLPEGTPMARANVKPRLRMAILYYLAQSNNYLVAGTSNKSELLVGYFTKYGDGGVDLEPIGDLYKSEVRALARILGVPEPIINRPPTAGLWPGQTDEGEMGITYDLLDSILQALEEGRTPNASEELVDRVRKMVIHTAHKRTLPPIYPIYRAKYIAQG